MLVNLRGQVSAHGSDPKYAVVWIENMIQTEIVSAARVYWQQAWGGTEAEDQAADYPLALGLANSGQVRTTDANPVPNTYNWAVNALGIKAASRFQLPLLNTASGQDAQSMGWQSQVPATEYDLVEGELYQDQALHTLMCQGPDRWYSLVQPDRVAVNLANNSTWSGGTEKNVVYASGSGNRTLNLDTTLTAVPPGSIVRVINLNTVVSGATITVKVGTSTLSAILGQHMSEFLFWVDDSGMSPVGEWLLLQGGVTAGQLP